MNALISNVAGSLRSELRGIRPIEIKQKHSTYANRRDFIWDEFLNLLNFLESAKTCVAESSISEGLLKFDEGEVYRNWKKALERKTRDPDGAITIARTLLESVCKHILDLQAIEYNEEKIELADLYKKTASLLSLHTSQHEQDLYKQILGGCSGIVNGLGQLRNKAGDSHAAGKNRRRLGKPTARHSELAVNLAGSMALFLVQTYEQNLPK